MMVIIAYKINKYSYITKAYGMVIEIIVVTKNPIILTTDSLQATCTYTCTCMSTRLLLGGHNHVTML